MTDRTENTRVETVLVHLAFGKGIPKLAIDACFGEFGMAAIRGHSALWAADHMGEALLIFRDHTLVGIEWPEWFEDFDEGRFYQTVKAAYAPTSDPMSVFTDHLVEAAVEDTEAVRRVACGLERGERKFDIEGWRVRHGTDSVSGLSEVEECLWLISHCGQSVTSGGIEDNVWEDHRTVVVLEPRP